MSQFRFRILAWLLLAPPALHAQKLPAFVTDSLDRYIAREMAAWNVPGQAASGKSWDDFVAERLFKPLGMTRSTTTHKAIANDTNACRPPFANSTHNQIKKSKQKTSVLNYKITWVLPIESISLTSTLTAFA